MEGQHMLMQLLTRHMAHGAVAIAARLSLFMIATCLVAMPSTAQTCTADDFARAVDQAGAALRDFNTENSPKITAAVKKIQEKRGWSDNELEDKAINFLHTPRIAELDEKANELLSKIDVLGDVSKRSLDCSKLTELNEAARELLTTMKEKSDLVQSSIAAELREGTVASAPPVAAPAPHPATPPAQPAPVAKSKQPEPPSQPKTSHAPPPAARTTAPSAPGSWDAATSRAPQGDARVAAAPDAYRPPAKQEPLPAPLPEAETGFSIDEIKAATRGLFGTLSTNLGSVIEYAFSNYGRPTAYVLGSEGGGAFLAGARFGKGALYMRTGQQREVYWHGPSLGYDFGAEGSRTLFLIYKLGTEEELFRRFGGVDGSAYVLGGVGLTLLKGGPVLMAPIRTGVGLRLGANIGYVRFTPHATWNPF